MKRILNKLILYTLALVILVSIGAFTQAEETGTYVLMNIPYNAFYAAEVTDTTAIDAVSSATLMKPRTGGLAGGSYHINADGSDITGVIFPVQVEDVSALAALGGAEITDGSSVSITVTNRGQESTTAYEGKDALFEAPSYSWYTLTEAPSQYKKLTIADGKPVFSKVNTEAESIAATARLLYDKHADQVIAMEGVSDALGDQQVSGIILVANDGTRVGLRHIANIWRGPEIGFNFDSAVYEALSGKTIVTIEILTKEGYYAFKPEIAIAGDQRLASLSDTYIELFPEFAREEYRDYWMECIKAYPVDDETAESLYTMLTTQFMGRLYGQEAIDAYSGDPASMLFDCFFENGLAKVSINGNIISGADADGHELFRHAYSYVNDVPVTYFGQEMPASLHIYQTEDADAGMFTYFAFSDDTLAEAQHIEFRYGETLENIGSYTEGVYAYWLTGAIQDGYSDKLIQACIKLFVDENVGEMFAEETATTDTEAVIGIATAEELAAVSQNLSGHYMLTADIDLNGCEWAPLGIFMPGNDENGEPTELPDLNSAFTGIFDGNGHTIRNFTISQGESYTAGLFGCLANASVSNLTVKDVSAEGFLMVSDVVGYSYMSSISGVKLENGAIHVIPNEMSEEGMFGGIVGASMGSVITDCEAKVDILIEEGRTANVGIVGGGWQNTSAENCIGHGSIKLGSDCYGIGGVSGCGFGSEYFTGCVAEDVTITVGDNCSYIGGITGYCGGYEPAELGVPVTKVSGCRTKNVMIVTGENAENIGDFVGGGFLSDEMIVYGPPFDQPTNYELADCVAE